jgi:integrase
MSVKIRPYRKGGWEVDIAVMLPDGTRRRERRRVSVSSKTAALRWAYARERVLLTQKPATVKRDVPTLAAFAPRFLSGYAVANRQKPSGVAAKETILRCHLVPLLGAKRLDAITNEDIQRLKAHLHDRATKTLNNTLSTLAVLLKVAVEWGVIERMPCTVRLLRVPQTTEMAFHDFAEFDRLVKAAQGIDPRAHLIVLLGGDAGLRCGEIQALEWQDVDLERRQLWVRRSEWKGHVGVPKGGRPRLVPLTQRLAAALRAYRHLQGPRVLCQGDGSGLTQKIVQVFVRRAARRAGLSNSGVHTLRHTFCSLLSMGGAPARAIQELAGHKDLATSQRYLHLSPGAIDAAIRLLEQPVPAQARGDILETEDPSGTK